MTAEIEDGFELMFDYALKQVVEYSVADLFRYLFNAPDVDEKHTFCSRYVMNTIMHACPAELWPLVRCMGATNVPSVDDDWVSPRDLFISPCLVPAEPLVTLSPSPVGQT